MNGVSKLMKKNIGFPWKVYTALSEIEKEQVEALALERDWSITKTLRFLIVGALAQSSPKGEQEKQNGRN